MLQQTFRDFELIIVDDGSTDNTEKVVEGFHEARVRYLRQNHKGVSAARNFGAAASNGKYLAFLDSDDEALPEWLQHFAEAFEQSGTGIVCCGRIRVPGKGDRTKDFDAVGLPRKMGPEFDNQAGLFLAGTFAVARELFDSIGGYAETLGFSENTELALRLISQCQQAGWKIAVLAKPLVTFYRPDSRAYSHKNFKQILNTAQYMLSRHRDKLIKNPRVYASYCGMAGVNSSRLGRWRDATRYFLSAIRVYPLDWKQYGRLCVALMGPFGARIWARHNTEIEP